MKITIEGGIGQLLKDYGQGEVVTGVERYGSGHIHKTYLIKGDNQRYILQSFNQQVFPYPDRIAGNLQLVKEHLEDRSLDFMLPLPMVTGSGQLFTVHESGCYRLFPYVSGECIDKVWTPEQAYLAAQAFGGFIKACSGINAGQLEEVIEGFHDLPLRFRQFETAVQKTQNPLGEEVNELIKFYKKQEILVRKYGQLEKVLPVRVTHNDTKISNVIFDNSFEKINAVIDLDTVMPGYVFYDFGDLVRTVTCTEEEASVDWDRMDVDLEKYKALLEGFINSLGDELTAEEKESLPFGGEMMACIMGLRFLTDYLNGNIYYPVNYSDQNLHRAKNQALLLQALQRKRKEISVLMDRIS